MGLHFVADPIFFQVQIPCVSVEQCWRRRSLEQQHSDDNETGATVHAEGSTRHRVVRRISECRMDATDVTRRVKKIKHHTQIMHARACVLACTHAYSIAWTPQMHTFRCAAITGYHVEWRALGDAEWQVAATRPVPPTHDSPAEMVTLEVATDIISDFRHHSICRSIVGSD